MDSNPTPRAAYQPGDRIAYNGEPIATVRGTSPNYVQIDYDRGGHNAWIHLDDRRYAPAPPLTRS